MQHLKEVIISYNAIKAVDQGTLADLPIRPRNKKTRLFMDNEYISGGYLAGFPSWVTKVYLVLEKYTRAHGHTPDLMAQTCFPSYETIMEEGGVSRNNISRAIKILKTHDIIACRHSNGGRKKSNLYILLTTTVWQPFNNSYIDTVLKSKKESQIVPKSYLKPYQEDIQNSSPVDTGNHSSKSVNEITSQQIIKTGLAGGGLGRLREVMKELNLRP